MLIEKIKKYSYILIIFLGILLRAFWLMYMPTVPVSDFAMYNNTAIQIAHGNFNIGAFVTPGYQITLGILYWIFGVNILVGKIFNVVLSILIMYLTYIIAKKVFGSKISLIAIAIVAISPLAIAYCNVLGTEILFCTILMFCIYILLFINNPYLLGIMMGYLILVRPIALLLPVVFISYVMFKDAQKLKERIKYSAVFLVMLGIALAPWVVRNYFTLGKPVLSNNGGIVLYINNNEYATGAWSDPYKYPNSPIKKYVSEHGYNELGIDKFTKKLAVEWIIANPSKFVNLGLIRLKNAYLNPTDIVWSTYIGEAQMHPITERIIHCEIITYLSFYFVVLIYMIYTLIRLIRHRKADFNSLVLIVFLYFTAMMFVFEGQSRYVFPLHPLFSIGVAFVAFNIFVKLRSVMYKINTKNLKLSNKEKGTEV